MFLGGKLRTCWKKIVLLANYAHKLLGDGKGISSFLLENVETCESWHRAKHMWISHAVGNRMVLVPT